MFSGHQPFRQDILDLEREERLWMMKTSPQMERNSGKNQAIMCSCSYLHYLFHSSPSLCPCPVEIVRSFSWFIGTASYWLPALRKQLVSQPPPCKSCPAASHLLLAKSSSIIRNGFYIITSTNTLIVQIYMYDFRKHFM